MSYVPSELRDATTRKLEKALADRDRALQNVRGDAHRLQRLAGALEADVVQQRRLTQQLQAEIQRAEKDLERERRDALDRLETLRRNAERQHQRLRESIQEAEERHRREWEELQEEIERLASQRQEREARSRQAAQNAFDRALASYKNLNKESIESMDLEGEASAATIRLDSSHALLSDPNSHSAEVLSVSCGAEEAVYRIESQLSHRQALLDSMVSSLREDVEWLKKVLDGEAIDSLDNQKSIVDELMTPERALMKHLIEHHLQMPLDLLPRWNGHAGRFSRLMAIREILAAEILAGRRTLKRSFHHEMERYALDHIWDDLELIFGRIYDDEVDYEGAHANPEDRKSNYSFFFKSPRGELVVEAPWSGQLIVKHENREIARYPLCRNQESEVLYLESLFERWERLSEKLENPHWDPKLHK